MAQELNIPIYRAKKIDSDTSKKITYQDIGREVEFSEDIDFKRKYTDELIDIEQIEDETYYRTKEGTWSYCRSIEYVDGYLISGNLIKPLSVSWTIDKRDKPYSIETGHVIEIDPSTLAIHFSDMMDSEGTEIFASLSEDGKGGDKIERYFKDEKKPFDSIALEYTQINWFTHIQDFEDWLKFDVIKATGIQE